MQLSIREFEVDVNDNDLRSVIEYTARLASLVANQTELETMRWLAMRHKVSFIEPGYCHFNCLEMLRLSKKRNYQIIS